MQQRAKRAEELAGDQIVEKMRRSALPPLFPVLLLDSKYQQNWKEGHYSLIDWVQAWEATELKSISCVSLMALLEFPILHL